MALINWKKFFLRNGITKGAAGQLPMYIVTRKPPSTCLKLNNVWCTSRNCNQVSTLHVSSVATGNTFQLRIGGGRFWSSRNSNMLDIFESNVMIHHIVQGVLVFVILEQINIFQLRKMQKSLFLKLADSFFVIGYKELSTTYTCAHVTWIVRPAASFEVRLYSVKIFRLYTWALWKHISIVYWWLIN